MNIKFIMVILNACIHAVAHALSITSVKHMYSLFSTIELMNVYFLYLPYFLLFIAEEVV